MYDVTGLLTHSNWFRSKVDRCSTFPEADRKTETGLRGYLKTRGIKRVFVAGLATDSCAALTAIDASEYGFEVYVVDDACRGIDASGSLAAAWLAMQKTGVNRPRSTLVTAA